LPIKKGRKGNICRIKDLDYKKIEEDAFKKANIFYDELIVARKIMDGIEQDPGMFMYNIFEKVEAMNIGIYDDDKKLIGLKDISRETIVKDNLHLFRWGTFAVVNEDGWNESGSMGWFGCSSYGDGQYMDWYKHYFDKFIMPREKDDFIAIVDCHI